MLLFVEGPDKAGKSTFIQRLKTNLGFVPFSLKYPASLEENTGGYAPCVPISLGGYFLGANTFLVEAYKAINQQMAFNLAVHRGYLSEYAYGPLFGRKPTKGCLRWWLRQWPVDTAVIDLVISHADYLQRVRLMGDDADAKDTISLAKLDIWNTIMSRYFEAFLMVVQEGKKVIIVDGTATSNKQMGQLKASLPKESYHQLSHDIDWDWQ